MISLADSGLPANAMCLFNPNNEEFITFFNLVCQGKKHIQLIRQNAGRLVNLVNKLLDFWKST
jgi:hypothetical protein